jgi:gluconolactonase
MKVDQQGNIYCTGPGGVWIINSSGKYLGRILMPEMPSNFAWGDPDWKTLYITARTSIYRIKLLVPGKPVP